MAILQANNDYYLLRKQAYVSKFLDRIKHPDSQRVSKEIVQYASSIKSRNFDKQVERILEQLEDHKPWEQIRGYAEFLKYKFYVNENVLIPRIETEWLVNYATTQIIKFIIDNPTEKLILLDVCTGTGCIAISMQREIKEKLSKAGMKLKRNQLTFIATDISRKALNIAKKNSKLNKSNINFIETDLLEAVDFTKFDGYKVFIISNPPYIPTRYIKRLQKSVKNFEPILALDGGKDGMNLYKSLLQQIRVKKIEIEQIYLEIDPLITKKISALAIKNKYTYSLYKDYMERIRFMVIQRSPKV